MYCTSIDKLKYALALILVGAALVLQPADAVWARGASEPTPPPAPDRRDAQLERAWLRQQRILNRLEFLFDHSEQRLGMVQELIDRAAEQGKDVGRLQAALDKFSDAIHKARPIFEATQGILNSHQGFDEQGNVIDRGRATSTVDEMRRQLGSVRDQLLEPGRDLQQAIRDARSGN
jgi:hypothetical protein